MIRRYIRNLYTLNNYVAAVAEWNEELGETIEISPNRSHSSKQIHYINEGKILPLDQEAVSVFFAKKENVLCCYPTRSLHYR